VPACIWIVECASDYVDGSLPRARAKLITRHLIRCRACARYVEQIRQIVRLLQNVAAPTLAPTNGNPVIDAFRSSRRIR
jgi:anti-sigma factor RsiW